MSYLAVIDTNIIISGLLKTPSIPRTILDLVSEGVLIPVIHASVMEEYEAVLGRPKFCINPIISQLILNMFQDSGVMIDETVSYNSSLPDEKDRIFYELLLTVQETDVAYLITGNLKHFPTSSFIVSPRQMIELIQNEKDY